MAENLETMLIKIDASTEAVRRELKRMDGSVQRTERKTNRSLSKIDSAFKNAARSVGALAAAYLSIRGAETLVRLGRDAIKTADNIQKTADTVGFMTDQLQELRYAAQRNGLSESTLDMALQRFSRRVGEVAQGQGELLKTAEQYNVQLRNTDGTMRSNIAILEDFANVIANAESQQEALRIAFKLFDSEGARLVTLMRQGSDGVRKFRQEAQDLGIVLGKDTIDKAVEAQDKLTDLQKQIDANLTEAFVNLAPAIISATEALASFTKSLGEVPAKANPISQITDDVDRLMIQLAYLQKKQIEQRANGDSFLDRIFGSSKEEINADIEDVSAQLKRLMELRRLAEVQAPNIPRLPMLPPRTMGITPRAKPFDAARGFIQERDKEVLDEINRSLDEADQKLAEVGKQIEANTQSTEAWMRSISDGFAEAILGARSFGDALKSILLQLAKAELSNTIFGSLTGKKSPSIIGGLAKSIGIPGFAKGGDTPVNRPFIVGENGPEIMSFNKSARVTPNGHMSGTVVNQNFSIQTGLPAQVVAQVRNIATDAANEANVAFARRFAGMR